MLAVQLHRMGKQAVQQIENTCCVPIDQCCCHTHDLFCCSGNFRHGVTLAGVIIVLMKFIGKERIDPPFHLFADIGAQRIFAGRNDRWKGVSLLRTRQLFQTFQNRRVIGFVIVEVELRQIDVPEIPNLGPHFRHGSFCQRRP